MFTVAQNGQELGQFSADQIRQLVADGALDDTAFYWREGMSEWKPLTSLFPPAPPEVSKPLEVLETKTVVHWGGALAADIEKAFCAAVKVKKYKSTYEHHVLSDVLGNRESIVVLPSRKNRIPAELALILGPAVGGLIGLAVAGAQTVADKRHDNRHVLPNDISSVAHDAVIFETASCTIQAKEVCEGFGLTGLEYARWLYLQGEGRINGKAGRISMRFGRESGTSLGRYMKQPDDWITKFCAALGKDVPAIIRGNKVAWDC